MDWIFQIILYAILIAVGLLVFLKISGGKSKKKGNSVLLYGPSESGKTAMYCALKKGKFCKTLSSLKEMSSIVELNSPDDKQKEEAKKVKIIDYPGHGELKNILFDERIKEVGCIVFVIDSIKFRNEKSDIALLLYELLTNPTVFNNEIPILISCNKSEVYTAVLPEKIKTELLDELNLIRDVNANEIQIEQAGNNGDEEKILLGIEGEKFKFEELPLQIQFTKCSVKTLKLDPVVEFILENIKGQ
eukprot:TRINITY_DN242_c0_g1_i1.p1 TRINITY_DN242_c0_g1~~TRINITY_DN242_c0_g1_i1.p1  ORF type:complete len:246 (-),score=57.75 TRINITY_DN242_c0_g1_i1:103-840(-)